jgi:hypothetical protein
MRISEVVPYYCDKGLLVNQINYWNNYPDWIKKEVEILIIDDATPIPELKATAVLSECDTSTLNIRVFEILRDVAWNHRMAMNLGADQATSKWLLLHDVDHAFPPESMLEIFHRALAPREFYFFKRRICKDINKQIFEDRPTHLTTLLIRKNKYWLVGGMDEDFSGLYGYTAAWFLARAKKHLTKVIWDDVTAHVFNRMQFPHPKMQSRVRNNKRARNLYNQKLAGTVPVSTEVLRIPWKEVELIKKEMEDGSKSEEGGSTEAQSTETNDVI